MTDVDGAEAVAEALCDVWLAIEKVNYNDLNERDLRRLMGVYPGLRDMTATYRRDGRRRS